MSVRHSIHLNLVFWLLKFDFTKHVANLSCLFIKRDLLSWTFAIKNKGISVFLSKYIQFFAFLLLSNPNYCEKIVLKKLDQFKQAYFENVFHLKQLHKLALVRLIYNDFLLKKSCFAVCHFIVIFMQKFWEFVFLGYPSVFIFIILTYCLSFILSFFFHSVFSFLLLFLLYFLSLSLCFVWLLKCTCNSNCSIPSCIQFVCFLFHI